MNEKFIKKFNSISTKVKTFAISTSAVAVTVLSSVPAHAEGATLDPTVEAAVTTGFTNASGAITVIVGLGVTATIGVLAVTGGARAGIKWVKGIFSKAS